MEDKFIDLCKKGKLDELKEIYRINNINIHIYCDKAFRYSCCNGHINVAQWLYSLGGIDIHAVYDYAFRLSCYNGHINIAQWLYSLNYIDIHAVNDDAFRSCCKIEIIKWLLLIGKFNNELVDYILPVNLYNYAFRLGYLPTNKMIPYYVDYKDGIRNVIMEKNKNDNISIFELSYLIDIIMVYI